MHIGDDVAPPALTRRVVRALELAHDAFASRADWYFFVDDDTFVRLTPLRARLATLNSSVPMMLGAPIESKRFLTKAAAASGESIHCGGGVGWALSAAAVTLLRPRLAECLSKRDVRLAFYYDEVVLGRCLHEMLGLTCLPLRGVVHIFRDAGHDETYALEPGAVGRGSETVADDDDLVTQHQALPDDMERLVAKFNATADQVWLRRLRRGELHRSEWWDTLVSPLTLGCVLLGFACYML